MGIVHIGGSARFGRAHHFQPARRTFERRDGRKGATRISARSHNQTGRHQRIGRLKVTDEREVDVVGAALMHNGQLLAMGHWFKTRELERLALIPD